MRVAWLVLTFLLVAGAARADEIHVTSPGQMSVDAQVQVRAPGGIAHGDQRGPLVLALHGVRGVITLSESDEVGPNTGIHVAAQSPHDQTFESVTGDLVMAVNQSDETTWSLLAGDGTALIATEAMQEQGVPRFLPAPIQYPSAPLPAAGPQQPYFQSWRWEAGWEAFGDLSQTAAGPTFPALATATLDVRGESTFWARGGLASFFDAGAPQQARTGVWKTSPLHDHEATLTFRGFVGSADLSFEGPTGFAAPQATWSLDGALEIPHATGRAMRNGAPIEFKDETLRVKGALDLVPSPGGAGTQFDATGRIDELSLSGARVVPPAVASPAKAVGAITGLALVLLVLARVFEGPLGRFAALLYTRVGAEEVATHPRRALILELVREQPGLHMRELQRRLDCGWGTLAFHARMLERAGFLRQERQGSYTALYAAGMAPGSAAIPAETARRIYETLPASGGDVAATRIMEQLGLSRQLLNYHVRTLQARGLVVDEGRGARRRLSRSPR